MDNTETSSKIKPLEELTQEGWKYAGLRFAYLKVYKNENKRIIYDDKLNIICKEYSIEDKK